MSTKASIKNFEANLDALENVVEKLESGELGLDEALAQFEKGIKMTRACQDALSSAEQRVKILMEKDGQKTLEDISNAGEE